MPWGSAILLASVVTTPSGNTWKTLPTWNPPLTKTVPSGAATMWVRLYWPRGSRVKSPNAPSRPRRKSSPLDVRSTRSSVASATREIMCGSASPLARPPEARRQRDCRVEGESEDQRAPIVFLAELFEAGGWPLLGLREKRIGVVDDH